MDSVDVVVVILVQTEGVVGVDGVVLGAGVVGVTGVTGMVVMVMAEEVEMTEGFSCSETSSILGISGLWVSRPETLGGLLFHDCLRVQRERESKRL